jgi:hypothetical protein
MPGGQTSPPGVAGDCDSGRNAGRSLAEDLPSPNSVKGRCNRHYTANSGASSSRSATSAAVAPSSATAVGYSFRTLSAQ